MDVKQIYQLSHRTSSFSVPKTVTGAIDPEKLKKRKRFHKEKPKCSFIDDAIKHAKQTPGANAYFKGKEGKVTKKSIMYGEGGRPKKIDFNAEMKKGTKTFIDDVIKQGSKVPGVGKYVL